MTNCKERGRLARKEKTENAGETPALRFAFLLLVSVFLVMNHSVSAATRPNVLLILSDDQGYGDLSLHGNTHLKTPNIDALGQNGIRFDRFFVSPLCAPTRASLLTGRYSLRAGVAGVQGGTETMNADETTIAEVLRDAGYKTGLFGKWHNGEHYPYTPQGQGFEEVLGFNLGHWNNYFNTTLKHNGQPVKTKGYITDVLTDAALQFIEDNKSQPFFCYVPYNVPHTPLQVPDKYFDAYKNQGLDDRNAAIYGMCAYMDDCVGKLLKKLDDENLRENTIVIFMGDNGPNGARFNDNMRGTKGSLHEGGSRVPCFWRFPARFQTPRKIDTIAAHIDVLPTLAELCGVPLPDKKPLDGRSLVPLMEGQTAGWPERILFNQHMANAKTGSLRTPRFRLVKERDWELFDMQNDAAEKQDVSADFPEVKTQLISAYQKWWDEVSPAANRGVPPIGVGYAQENPVELPVPQSKFSGGLKYSGKHPNNAWLTGWKDANATVLWNLDVVQGGHYEVSLLYSAPEKTHVKISCGANSVENEAPKAIAIQVPSPDRVPRDEVYEMEWATFKVGTISLPKGEATLKVTATPQNGQEALDLKSVILRRMD